MPGDMPPVTLKSGERAADKRKQRDDEELQQLDLVVKSRNVIDAVIDAQTRLIYGKPISGNRKGFFEGYSPVNLPTTGLEYKETAPGSIGSIIRPGYQKQGSQLAEQLVRNVFKTLTEKHLERYMLAKERFERAISENPFFKQTEREKNGLLESYINFKAELSDIKKTWSSPSVGRGWPSVPAVWPETGLTWLVTPLGMAGMAGRRGSGKGPEIPRVAGEDGQPALRIPTTRVEYSSSLKVPDGLNFWRIVEKVFSRSMAGKQILEIHKRGYSRIREREERAQLQRTKSARKALTNITRQEDMIKQRESKQLVLKLLQNQEHVVLSGNVKFQDSRAGGLELVIPTPPSAALNYSSGYNKNMPPITYKSSERVPEKQRELVVKSLNTPTDSQTRTIKKSVDLDLNSTQLSNLVDKVYAQLESRLAWERRRYGY